MSDIVERLRRRAHNFMKFAPMRENDVVGPYRVEEADLDLLAADEIDRLREERAEVEVERLREVMEMGVACLPLVEQPLIEAGKPSAYDKIVAVWLARARAALAKGEPDG